MGFRIEGLGCGVWGLGLGLGLGLAFGVLGLGSRVKDSGYRVQGDPFFRSLQEGLGPTLCSPVQAPGFRVQSLGFRTQLTCS